MVFGLHIVIYKCHFTTILICEFKNNWLIFVVQMEGIHTLTPNDETHPAFGAALREAAQAGVHILALGCHVEPDGAEITYDIPVSL